MASIFCIRDEIRRKKLGTFSYVSVMVKPDRSEVALPDHPFLFQQITKQR